MCRPLTTSSLAVFAAAISLASLSSWALSLPSQLKSRPSAPAFTAASAPPAVTFVNSRTMAAARGLVSPLLRPRKPILPPLAALRACVNISCNFAIVILLLLIISALINAMMRALSFSACTRQRDCLHYSIVLLLKHSRRRGSGRISTRNILPDPRPVLYGGKPVCPTLLAVLVVCDYNERHSSGILLNSWGN